jgi:hypothetical protein
MFWPKSGNNHPEQVLDMSASLPVFALAIKFSDCGR